MVPSTSRTFVTDYGEGRRGAQDWREGIIVSFQKTDDLSNCNNWRGVTLFICF